MIRIYKRVVKFEKQFVIHAANAKEANEKLADAILSAEFDAGVTNDEGFQEFEDEPIQCPKCLGTCEMAENITCDLCKGDGGVPFGTVYESTPSKDAA